MSNNVGSRRTPIRACYGTQIENLKLTKIKNSNRATHLHSALQLWTVNHDFLFLSKHFTKYKFNYLIRLIQLEAANRVLIVLLSEIMLKIFTARFLFTDSLWVLVSPTPDRRIF